MYCNAEQSFNNKLLCCGGFYIKLLLEYLLEYMLRSSVTELVCVSVGVCRIGKMSAGQDIQELLRRDPTNSNR